MKMHKEARLGLSSVQLIIEHIIRLYRQSSSLTPSDNHSPLKFRKKENNAWKDHLLAPTLLTLTPARTEIINADVQSQNSVPTNISILKSGAHKQRHRKSRFFGKKQGKKPDEALTYYKEQPLSQKTHCTISLPTPRWKKFFHSTTCG